MSILTDSERKLLSDLREAEARATNGPWDHGYSRMDNGDYVVWSCDGVGVCRLEASDVEPGSESKRDFDSGFIALARNSLTPLLDLVERLDREANQYKELFNKSISWKGPE